MTRPTQFSTSFPQGVGIPGGDPALPPGQPELDCCEDEVFPDRAFELQPFVGVQVSTLSLEILADGPEWYYKFDEPSGAFVDSSLNSVTATEGGTYTRSVSGAFPTDKAITGSTGDLLTLGYTSGPATEETLELWVKTAATGLVTFEQNRFGSGVGVALQLAMGSTGQGAAAGQLTAYMNATSFWQGIHTTATFNDDAWHHVVAVWTGGTPDASNFLIYVDGVLEATTSDSNGGSRTSPISGDGNMTICSSTEDVSYTEMAFYESALDAARVLAHFEAAGETTVWGGTGAGITDGDDTTYQTVIGPDVLRIDLGAPFEVARVRLLIGSELSGARSYELRATNDPTFSTSLLVTTLAWTATGSYTADDVTDSWIPSAAYQYWQLTGNDETRRIYSFELYEGDFTGTGRWELAVIPGSPPDSLYADGDWLYIFVA